MRGFAPFFVCFNMNLFRKIYNKIKKLINPDDDRITIHYKTREDGRHKEITVRENLDKAGQVYYYVLSSYGTLLKPGCRIYPIYKNTRFDGKTKAVYAHIFDEKGSKMKGFYHFREIKIVPKG